MTSGTCTRVCGGVAPNAVFGLVELLGQCKGASGKVLIPGFFDDMEEPADEELEIWNRLPFNEDAYLSTKVRTSALTGEAGFSVIKRVRSRPTCEVRGIPGGFTGPGARTVIAATATAKVSAWLVPRQDAEKMLLLATEFAASRALSGIDVEVRLVHSAPTTIVATELSRNRYRCALSPTCRVARLSSTGRMGQSPYFRNTGPGRPSAPQACSDSFARAPEPRAARGVDGATLAGSRPRDPPPALAALGCIRNAALGEAPPLRHKAGRLVTGHDEGPTASPLAAARGARVRLELGPVRGTL